jgi:short-subunit dehydrogenase
VSTRDLRRRVIVIVGASSGVGRAAALGFADHGCRLVLAARSERVLHEVAVQCRARGAETVVVPADVADPVAVDRIGCLALDAYGCVDVWVHAAAGIVAARFGDEPLDELRRLVDVDILGYVHGARTAVSIFRRQRYGMLVNVGSVLGIVPNPLVPTYVMSKFAVTGLTRAIASGTEGDGDIDVCLVLPGPVDTPLFQHAANHTGRQIRAIRPACAPERAAAAIVRCAQRPRRQVPVGLMAYLVMLGHRTVPVLTDRFVAAWSGRLILGPNRAPNSPGTLFEPAAGGQVHGGWRRCAWRRRLGEWVGRTQSRRGVRRSRPVAIRAQRRA